MRDIEELLYMDTYQGMTDEEIESVISWRINQATDEKELELRAEGLQKSSKQMLDETHETAELLKTQFNAMIAKIIGDADE